MIEHIRRGPAIFAELNRVLGPGGVLIIGTPDYARASWRILEWLYSKVAPRAYAEQHITHYTNEELSALLAGAGFEVLDCQYVLGSEMIFKAAKVGC